MSDFDENDPKVIAAQAEATKVKLEARAKLHPLAQIVYTLTDGLGSVISTVFGVIIILVIILAIFAPTVLQAAARFLFGG